MTRDTFGPLLEFFERHELIPDAPVVVDVGCCLGWFTEEFLAFWPQARVLGIDIDERVKPGFLHGTEGKQVEFLHAGLADYDGEAVRWMSPQRHITEIATLVNRNGEHPAMQWVQGSKVRVRRLDSLVEDVDVIKIDAELMDLRVIQGATGLLKRQRPKVILFEIVDQTLGYDPQNPRSVLDLFRPYGYRVFVTHMNYSLIPFSSTFSVNNVAILESAYWHDDRYENQPGTSSL